MGRLFLLFLVASVSGVRAFADPVKLGALIYQANHSANPDFSSAAELTDEERKTLVANIYDNSVVNLKHGEFLGTAIAWMVANDPARGADLLKIMVTETKSTYKDGASILLKEPQGIREQVFQKLAPDAFGRERPEVVELLIQAGYRFNFAEMLLAATQDCNAELLYKARLFTDLDATKVVDLKSGLTAVQIAERGAHPEVALVGSSAPPNPASARCALSAKILAEKPAALSAKNYFENHGDLKVPFYKSWITAMNVTASPKTAATPEAVGADR